jgi:hypothetical protein
MTQPDLPRGSLSGRVPWWLGGVVIGALLGGLFASLGGIVLGLVFVLPFAAARGRAGAAIAGGLLGAGVAGIVVHGIALDINTAAAAITLAAGLLLSGVALTRR